MFPSPVRVDGFCARLENSIYSVRAQCPFNGTWFHILVATCFIFGGGCNHILELPSSSFFVGCCNDAPLGATMRIQGHICKVPHIGDRLQRSACLKHSCNDFSFWGLAATIRLQGPSCNGSSFWGPAATMRIWGHSCQVLHFGSWLHRSALGAC